MREAPGARELRRFVRGCVDRGEMPGAAWCVSDPGGDALATGVAGLACVHPRTPVTPETPWDLASLTKALATAPLLLLAAQDGRLELDDRVGEHLPAFASSPWGDVTLRALATHVSGMPAWLPLYVDASSVDGYLQAIAALPSRPAGSVEYSDLGYIVLGAVLERIWGDALDRVFDSRLVRPAGLSRLGFAGNGSAWADAAATEAGNAFERERVGDRGRAVPWRTETIRGTVHDGNCWALGGVAGHAGLFGTMADVVRLVRLLMAEDGPLDGASRRRWLVADPSAATRTVGLVTAAGSSAARGALPDDAVGHVGFTGTSFWIEPAAGRTYVLLTNRVHPEVTPIDFQAVRHAFHRCASREL